MKFPLDFFVKRYYNSQVRFIGMWLSLVEHYVRDVGAAGSNPVIPTTSEQALLAPIFYASIKNQSLAPLLLLFRKKDTASRLVRL